MWANPARGEAALETEAQTYVLRPSLHALCGLEEATGVWYAALLGRVPTLDADAERSVVFAVLQAKHGREVRSLEVAGEVIDAAGGHGPVMRSIRRMLQANRPPHSTLEGSERPPLAQLGTGLNSPGRLGGSGLPASVSGA